MARRSGRMPAIIDPEPLLAELRACRQRVTHLQAGVEIHSDHYRALEAFRVAIDDMAGALTGDREHLWTKPHSIGKNG